MQINKKSTFDLVTFHTKEVAVRACKRALIKLVALLLKAIQKLKIKNIIELNDADEGDAVA